MAKEFAVIKTGGKQYKVSKGDTIKIEKLPKEHKIGGKVAFNKVLLFDDGKSTKVGTPYIDKAKVTGTFQGEGKAKKIDVIRFKAKSRYFKKKGHRQPYTLIKVESLK